MTDLIATLEGLTSPSREVDEAMRIHFKYPPKPWNYTASLDAITALVERVLPDALWDIGKGGVAKLLPNIFSRHIEVVTAATPAIALCIALIRALEARDGKA